MDIFDILSLTIWAGALISLVIYVYAYILRPQGDRLLSTVGLFLTAVGLSQLPLFMKEGADGPNFMNGAFAAVAFLAAAAAQAVTAVRGRKSRSNQRTRASDRAGGDQA